MAINLKKILKNPLYCFDVFYSMRFFFGPNFAIYFNKTGSKRLAGVIIFVWAFQFSRPILSSQSVSYSLHESQHYENA